MTHGRKVLALTLTAAGQRLALPVAAVQDVFRPGPITPVPLAPPGLAGVLNLRGRVVTAIDLRAVLGLSPWEAGVAVILEAGGDRYAILADAAGDVVPLDAACAQPLPPTVGAAVSSIASGLYRLDEGLVTLVDPGRLLARLGSETPGAAA